MTEKQFVTWLTGFIQASNSYNITPKQWDDIKETLKRVKSSDIHGEISIENTSNVNSTANVKTILHD